VKENSLERWKDSDELGEELGFERFARGRVRVRVSGIKGECKSEIPLRPDALSPNLRRAQS